MYNNTYNLKITSTHDYLFWGIFLIKYSLSLRSLPLSQKIVPQDLAIPAPILIGV